MPNTESKPDLKLLLMTLGNRLVTERKYTPGPQPFEFVADPEGDGGGVEVQLYDADDKRTSIITLFTEFLNKHSDAQEILNELGYAWPVVERPRHGSAT